MQHMNIYHDGLITIVVICNNYKQTNYHTIYNTIPIQKW